MTNSLRNVLWVFAVLVTGVLIDAKTPVRAQYTVFDFFEQGYRASPSQSQRRYQRRYQYEDDWDDDDDRWRRRERRDRQRMRERREVSADSPKWTEMPKNADAKVILVIGDQMADGLAQGLREAFSADPGARIVSAAKEGLGLAGKQAGTFAQFAKDKLAAENAAAIIVMAGINDRGDADDNGKSTPFRSDRWRTLYFEHAESLMQALKGKPVPVYWVGLPSALSKEMSGDLAYLNGLYRQKAYAAGAKFIDVWEGFVDEDGDYMAIGPDVNGNQRRLRLRDGMTLTPAGNRKLAFYAEKELRRDLSFAQSPKPAMPETVGPSVNEDANKPAVSNAYTGPVIPLGKNQETGGAALMGATFDTNETTGSVSQAPLPKPGRSDDFAWPLEARQKLPPVKAEKPEVKLSKKKN